MDIQININKNSFDPKYMQVADCISNAILSGKIKKGDRIPSINELSNSTSLSRDTIEKAYNLLRERNFIFSVKHIGNFVTNTGALSKINVLFFINKSSSYKLEVYNSFVQTLGEKANVTLYIYNYDELLFTDALKNNYYKYNYFIIMPHFRDEKQNYLSFTPKVIDLIENLPKHKLLIIDNLANEIKGNFTCIYQDFKEDIIYALEKAKTKLKKYKQLILVYPTRQAYPFPTGIMLGFKSFCTKHHINHTIIETIDNNHKFEPEQAYITLDDENLIQLIQNVKNQSLDLGKDIGLISYNETPLKELYGISVFSTDFKEMGIKTAQLILNNKKEISKNKFYYIERNSL